MSRLLMELAESVVKHYLVDRDLVLADVLLRGCQK